MLSKKLAEQLAAKRTEFNDIFTKGDNASDEEVKRAETLVTEIDDLEGKHASALRTEAFAEKNRERLDEMKNTPVNNLPFSQRAPETTFEGKEGEIVVDTKSREIVEESGTKVADKVLAAICSKSYRDAFWKGIRGGVHSLSSNEIKTLSEGNDGSGGTTVPVQFLARLIAKKPTPTRIAERVTRLTTNSDKLEIPRVVYNEDDLYTTGMRVTWSGETTTSDEHLVDDPEFGNIMIPIHKATMSMDVTENLLDDSAFNLESWIVDKFVETKALLYDHVVLRGDGRGKPAGMLINPGGENQPGIVVTGNANNVTADGLFDQAYAVPEQYDENCVWIFNKTKTGRAIAKLKDDTNRYLFGKGSQDDGIASARPTELLGYPYLYSGFMPDPAANAFPTIFGDPRGYYFVERMLFSIVILNEIKALEGKKVIYGRVRIGGQMAEPWRMKIGKCST